jgi:hypothetical protein
LEHKTEDLLITDTSTVNMCTVVGRPPSASRVVDCHWVKELRFQLVDRKDATLLKTGAV